MFRLFLIGNLFVTSFLYSETISGRVVKVSDGDTINVLSNHTEYKVRLNGIDAPEKSQSFGNVSKYTLASLIYLRKVKVELQGKDRYNRYLGKVYLRDRDINLEMIQRGLAWHYKKYSKESEYAKAEEVAREEKIGLWVDVSPIPPWQFRKNKKEINYKGSPLQLFLPSKFVEPARFH